MSHGMVFASSGYYKFRHRPVGSSKITLPLVYGDYYCMLMDQGFPNCRHVMTGEELYDRKRLPGSGRFMTSPWAYSDRLFCLSEKGRTYVVKPGPEFEILQTNDLDERCIATPAIAQGELLIRTKSRLYCFSHSISEIDK